MPYQDLFSAISHNIGTFIITGGYPVLFVLALLEGVPLIGLVIPGHTAIIASGFFARLGYFNIWTVIILASIGALLGDAIGFYLGRRYGMAFVNRLRPFFFIKDSSIQKARDLLSKHTGKAVIIGRFSPMTRALMPFLVGASKTAVGRFWAYNVVGAVSWAVSAVLIGYALGEGYRVAASYLGKISLVAILIAIIVIWGYKFINMRFPIFRKYELFTLTFNVLSLWGLGSMIDALTDQTFRLSFDVWSNGLMTSLDQAWPLAVTVALWISYATNVWVTAGIGVAIGAYFLYRKKWRSAVISFASVGVTALAIGIMKTLFMSARPANALMQVFSGGPSFPSGHSAMAAALFIVVAYLFMSGVRSLAKRESLLVLGVLTVMLVGVSRLILHVHWATDVIGGWSLGVFVSTGMILLVRYVGAIIVSRTEAR